MTFQHYLMTESKSKISAAQWESLITSGWNKHLTGKNDIKTLRNSNVTITTFLKNEKVVSKIVKNMLQTFPSSVRMVHFGSGKGKLSSNWLGSNTTPKTDMYLQNGNIRISLKMAGASQLMSGQKKETISTFNGAVAHMQERSSKSMTELVTVIQRKFESVHLDKEDVKDLKKYLNIQEVHRQLSTSMQEFFSNNAELKAWFSYEAMTGDKKFSDGMSNANYLMKFSPSGKSSIKPINYNYAKGISKKMSLSVSFKSHGTTLRNSVLRLHINDAIEEINGILLNESEYLNEKIFNVLKRFVKWIIGKIQTLLKKGFQAVLNFFGLTVDTIQVKGLSV